MQPKRPPSWDNDIDEEWFEDLDIADDPSTDPGIIDDLEDVDDELEIWDEIEDYDEDDDDFL